MILDSILYDNLILSYKKVDVKWIILRNIRKVLDILGRCKMLEKQKQDLLNNFKTKLQQLNPTQTIIVRQFLSSQKNKEN